MKQLKKQDFRIKFFTAFMINIKKTLHLKLNINSLILLFKHFYHKLKLFQFSEADKFLLFQKFNINYKIKFKKINDKDSEAL